MNDREFGAVNAKSKAALYVGGLDELVDEKTLKAAFLPFGEIMHVFLPPSSEAGKRHRGFGYVEYEEVDDAKAAMDNLNLNEIMGRVIKVNWARAVKSIEGSARAGKFLHSSDC
jgi:peptidyl-prolyl isomerase E (cyclophilin E)